MRTSGIWSCKDHLTFYIRLNFTGLTQTSYQTSEGLGLGSIKFHTDRLRKKRSREGKKRGFKSASGEELGHHKKAEYCEMPTD